MDRDQQEQRGRPTMAMAKQRQPPCSPQAGMRNFGNPPPANGPGRATSASALDGAATAAPDRGRADPASRASRAASGLWRPACGRWHARPVGRAARGRGRAAETSRAPSARVGVACPISLVWRGAQPCASARAQPQRTCSHAWPAACARRWPIGELAALGGVGATSNPHFRPRRPARRRSAEQHAQRARATALNLAGLFGGQGVNPNVPAANAGGVSRDSDPGGIAANHRACGQASRRPTPPRCSGGVAGKSPGRISDLVSARPSRISLVHTSDNVPFDEARTGAGLPIRSFYDSTRPPVAALRLR